ncbi:MAG TPA: hypothetical protein VGV40_02110 [Solirubrobacteraceae bacterium]|nr:hypothetical protein [Solirubrobacteraceae bacterium]
MGQGEIARETPAIGPWGGRWQEIEHRVFACRGAGGDALHCPQARTYMPDRYAQAVPR